MIDSILEFIGLKKTYAIEQPVEGEQGGHWLCYKTVTVTRDVAQETTVSTQNNPVAFAYTIPPLLPIYNYNAYNDN